MSKNYFYVDWADLETVIQEDGSLDKGKLLWLSNSQMSAVIQKLHLNWQQLKVQNNILQGKINAYQNN